MLAIFSIASHAGINSRFASCCASLAVGESECPRKASVPGGKSRYLKNACKPTKKRVHKFANSDKNFPLTQPKCLPSALLIPPALGSPPLNITTIRMCLSRITIERLMKPDYGPLRLEKLPLPPPDFTMLESLPYVNQSCERRPERGTVMAYTIPTGG
jgi:hypothetical protein